MLNMIRAGVNYPTYGADNTELLDALFKVITAYRVTYAAVLSDFRTYSARNVQSYFINPASSALQDAARTHKGSFLLSDSDFTDGLIFYLSNITKEPDRTSVVEKNLFNAKSTLAEIIGGGLDSIFWYENLWEEISASFLDRG